MSIVFIQGIEYELFSKSKTLAILVFANGGGHKSLIPRVLPLNPLNRFQSGFISFTFVVLNGLSVGHTCPTIAVVLGAVHPQTPHSISFGLELFAINGVPHFTFVKRFSLCSQFAFCCDAKSGFLPECVVLLRQQNTKTRLTARTKRKEIEERKKNRRLNSVSKTQHPADELATLRQHRLTVVSLTDTSLFKVISNTHSVKSTQNQKLYIYPCSLHKSRGANYTVVSLTDTSLCIKTNCTHFVKSTQNKDYIIITSPHSSRFTLHQKSFTPEAA